VADDSPAPLDAHKLRQFLAVVDNGHIGRAAEALGISQQAASKAVAQLEAQLEVRLLERGAFGVRPTPAGQLLAQRGRLAMAELAMAQAEIDAWRGARAGELRVGVGLGFTGQLMPAAIARFRRAHPGVHISAVVESSAMLFPMLLRGELEFVVSAPPAWVSVDPELRQEPLFAERDLLVAGARHPLARRTRLGLADLREYPWILSAQLTEVWQRLCRQFAAESLEPPKELLRTDSIALARELMMEDHYLCVVSRDTVARDLGARSLVALALETPIEPRTAFLTWRRKQRPQPNAAALMQQLREVCAAYNPRL
jgi:LysR family transcriptional regulator, regulator for genes of the gallate degradation pathway